MLPCFETQYMFKGLIILGRSMIKDSKSHVILELKLAVPLWQHELVTVSSGVYFCLHVSLPQLICAVTPPYKSTVHSRKWQLERWRDLSLRLTTLQLPAGQLELEKWSRPGGDGRARLAGFGSLHLDVSRPAVDTCGRSVQGSVMEQSPRAAHTKVMGRSPQWVYHSNQARIFTEPDLIWSLPNTNSQATE